MGTTKKNNIFKQMWNGEGIYILVKQRNNFTEFWDTINFCTIFPSLALGMEEECEGGWRRAQSSSVSL